VLLHQEVEMQFFYARLMGGRYGSREGRRPNFVKTVAALVKYGRQNEAEKAGLVIMRFSPCCRVL
jgi:hypothetical protein